MNIYSHKYYTHKALTYVTHAAMILRNYCLNLVQNIKKNITY
jgi:hypothetical protein